MLLIKLTKVIILGDSGVGKTSLMNQYVRESEKPCLLICVYMNLRGRSIRNLAQATRLPSVRIF